MRRSGSKLRTPRAHAACGSTSASAKDLTISRRAWDGRARHAEVQEHLSQDQATRVA